MCFQALGVFETPDWPPREPGGCDGLFPPSWLWGVPLQALPGRQQREKNEGAVPYGGILK